MATRLDRLTTLLDTGSSELVRETAARQIADILRSHPEELQNLLARVAPLLRSPTWATRVVAGKAVSYLLQNVPQFDADAVKTTETTTATAHASPDTSANATANLTANVAACPTSGNDLVGLEHKQLLSSLDIVQVIKNGKELLGSTGQEFEAPAMMLSATAKKNISRKLGLGTEYMDEDILNDSIDEKPADRRIFGQETFSVNRKNSLSSAKSARPSISSASSAVSSATDTCATVTSELHDDYGGLSVRQRNALKRKAKMLAKQLQRQQQQDFQAEFPDETNKRRKSSALTSDQSGILGQDNAVKQEPDAVKLEIDGTVQETVSVKQETDSIQETVSVKQETNSTGQETISVTEGEERGQLVIWQFEDFAQQLIDGLYNSSWWVRHGSALGLRELLKYHGASAGRRVGYSKETNDMRNSIWLNDIACRVLTIFALDRFGDYVSDQVVAPIRESATQVLGALLLFIDTDAVSRIFSILRLLLFQDHKIFKGQNIWQVTHGAMLGLKFLIAVRSDFVFNDNDTLNSTIACVQLSLSHYDDDVRAVAAQALMPVVDRLVTQRIDSVMELLFIMWSALEESKDELTASIGSIMDLMAKMFSSPAVLERLENCSQQEKTQSLEYLVPRLLPFLRHTILSVRIAVVHTLQILAQVNSKGSLKWITSLLLRLIFQNLILERDDDLRGRSLELWQLLLARMPASTRVALVAMADDLWRIASQPFGASKFNFRFNRLLLVDYNNKPLPPDPVASMNAATAQKVDAAMLQGDLELVTFDTILSSRIQASEAIGYMLGYVNDSQVIVQISQELSKSAFATPRFLFGFLATKYVTTTPAMELQQNTAVQAVNKRSATDVQRTKEILPQLGNVFIQLLSEKLEQPFQEIVPVLSTLRAQCHSFLNAITKNSDVEPQRIQLLADRIAQEGQQGFSVQLAEDLIGREFDDLSAAVNDVHEMQMLYSLRNTVSDTITTFKEQSSALSIRIAASAASSLCRSETNLRQIGIIVQPLMESVKLESCLILQRLSAANTAALLLQLVEQDRHKVLNKIIANLCIFSCVDPASTLEFFKYSQFNERILLESEIACGSDSSAALKIKARGAQLALKEILVLFKHQVFAKLPKFESCLFDAIEGAFGNNQTKDAIKHADSNITENGIKHRPNNHTKDADASMQPVIDGFSIIQLAVQWLDPKLAPTVTSRLPLVFQALQSEYWVVRNAAAKCLAAICEALPHPTLQLLVRDIVPRLSDALNLRARMGAIEAIACVVQRLDVKILPYIIFLIVPVLGRMSDADADVRACATTIFAQLVKLLPLESGIPDPPDFPPEMIRERSKEREFTTQMLNPSAIEPFQIPVAIRAELRPYQREGVSWLNFLNKYNLHGILCDDMGLGKTLQTICIVASDHYERGQRFELEGKLEFAPIASLIICPATLVGHWEIEIAKFAPFLSCCAYVGPPSERARLRGRLRDVSVVVTSYEICRSDIALLKQQPFNYCVLDEGQIIKNPRSKLTEAVKMIKSSHRLILSGTPIQNNLLELWSLFNFLMPGFLGSEQSFHARFSKPVNASRDSGKAGKDVEAASVALDALHKQVLPFLLRRLKSDVLLDLPPKIMQDYYCDLSPIQRELYEHFELAQQQNTDTLQLADTAQSKDVDNVLQKKRVFQSLQYLRKLCNHPALVLTPRHPRFNAVSKQLREQDMQLNDIRNAPKLQALKELLLDCGIGVNNGGVGGSADIANQHRVLIFFQLREMLDIVEHDLLEREMPSVSYLRLDGKVDPRARFQIVHKFNTDVSVDVLLLTTHVGGLGLNLTGADTVIFVEHDWNPMKDLQAMDRAHRVGQKRVVNVYRLITRSTLEEKIMGLQQFKIGIASTVIDEQNTAMKSMNNDELLDLFKFSQESFDKRKTTSVDQDSAADSPASLAKVIPKGAKNMLSELRELWNEDEYSEFNLDGFLASLPQQNKK